MKSKTEKLIENAYLVYRWPQAMRAAVAQTTPEEFQAAVTEIATKAKKTDRMNRPLAELEDNIVRNEVKMLGNAIAGDPCYPNKTIKESDAKKALIEEVAKKPRLVLEAEADNYAGYLVITPDNIIALAEYAGPVEKLEELSLRWLGELAEADEDNIGPNGISTDHWEEIKELGDIAKLLDIPHPAASIGLDMKKQLTQLAKREAQIRQTRGVNAEIAEEREAQLSTHFLTPERLKIITEIGQAALAQTAKTGRQGELAYNWLKATKNIPAIDMIAFMAQTGLAEDGGERYRSDLVETDGIGQLKTPQGTDLGTISFEEFQRNNPEIRDDLSGELDGTKTRVEKRNEFLTKLGISPAPTKKMEPAMTI